MRLKQKLYPITMHVIVVLSMFVTLPLLAQPSKGLSFDDAEYSKVKAKSPAQSFTSTTYDPVYSLRSYCPTPGNQGRLGSCVGWATAYGAYTVSVAIAKEIKTSAILTKEAFSPLFVYNQIKVSDCRGGSQLIPAFELLKSKGVCRISEFNPTDCAILPDSALIDNARVNRIKSYQSLFPVDAHPDNKVAATLQEIAKNRPVVIGMNVTASFDSIGKTGVWNPIPGEQLTGGHAMVVVGYDQINRRFEIMNSWGPNHGDNGFVYVGFADFGKYCRYGITMILEDKIDEPFNFQGSLYLDKIVGYNSETKKYIYNKIDAYREGEYYRLNEGQLNLNNYFKVMATEMKNGNALYIFSIKPDGSGELLFPTKHKDAFGVSLVDNPIILDVDSYVQLPTDNKSYIADQAGDDSLIFLFSKQEIQDPEQIVRQVAGGSGDLMGRLKDVLGNRLVPSSAVNFDAKKMQFVGSSTIGTIVPIIMKASINP
jgi:hypothetical protein